MQNPNINKKILIVEDDMFLRDIYIRVFEKAGYTVISAEDGEQALSIAASHPDASIMMLDIMIPKINGIDVLRRLKSQENTKQIPVVLLTNLGEESVLQEGFKLGAVDNILKVNLTPPEVVDHVTAMFEKAKGGSLQQNQQKASKASQDATDASQSQQQIPSSPSPPQTSNNTTPDQQ